MCSAVIMPSGVYQTFDGTTMCDDIILNLRFYNMVSPAFMIQGKYLHNELLLLKFCTLQFWKKLKKKKVIDIFRYIVLSDKPSKSQTSSVCICL